jgi:hypothetical protein
LSLAIALQAAGALIRRLRGLLPAKDAIDWR